MAQFDDGVRVDGPRDAATRPDVGDFEGDPGFVTDINTLFQQAVFESADRQLDGMAKQLADRQAALASVQQSRQDLGVALGRGQQQLRLVEAKLKATERELAASQSTVKQQERRLVALSGEVATEHAAAVVANAEVASASIVIAKQSTELRDLRTAADAMHNNGQVQSRILDRVAAEAVDEKLAARQAAEAALKRAAERDELRGEVGRLREQLELQVGETKVAMRQLEKVSEELEAAEGEKELLRSQWSAAMAAMTKRDDTLRELQGQRMEALSEAVVATRAARALDEEVKGKEEKLGSLEAQLERQRMQLNHAESVAGAAQRTAAAARAEVKEAKSEINVQETQMSALKNKAAVAMRAAEAAERKRVAAEQKVAEVAQSVEEAKKDGEKKAAAALKEGRADARQAVEQLQDEVNTIHVNHANEAAALRLQLISKAKELEEAQAAEAAAQTAYRGLQANYKALSTEAVKLRDQLPREVMRSDLAVARVQRAEASSQRRVEELKRQLKQVQEELVATKAELGTMKLSFMDAEEGTLRERKSHQKLHDRITQLEGEVFASHSLAQSLRKQLAEVEKSAGNNAVKRDLAHVTINKLERELAATKETVRRQELTMKNLHLAMQARAEKMKADVAVAKAEVVKERSLRKQNRADGLRSREENALVAGLEKRLALAEERLQRTKLQLVDAEARQQDSAAQANKLRGEYSRAQRHLKAFIRQFQRLFANPRVLASLGSTGGSLRDRSRMSLTGGSSLQQDSRLLEEQLPTKGLFQMPSITTASSATMSPSIFASNPKLRKAGASLQSLASEAPPRLVGGLQQESSLLSEGFATVIEGDDEDTQPLGEPSSEAAAGEGRGEGAAAGSRRRGGQDGMMLEEMLHALQRAHTVSAERLNEVQALKREAEEARAGLEFAEGRFRDKASQLRDAQEKLHHTSQRTLVLARRCHIAETVAASLDLQLRALGEVSAGTTVTYSYKPGLRPSSELQKALQRALAQLESGHDHTASADAICQQLDAQHKAVWGSSLMMPEQHGDDGYSQQPVIAQHAGDENVMATPRKPQVDSPPPYEGQPQASAKRGERRRHHGYHAVPPASPMQTRMSHVASRQRVAQGISGDDDDQWRLPQLAAKPPQHTQTRGKSYTTPSAKIRQQAMRQQLAVAHSRPQRGMGGAASPLSAKMRRKVRPAAPQQPKPIRATPPAAPSPREAVSTFHTPQTYYAALRKQRTGKSAAPVQLLRPAEPVTSRR